MPKAAARPAARIRRKKSLPGLERQIRTRGEHKRAVRLERELREITKAAQAGDLVPFLRFARGLERRAAPKVSAGNRGRAVPDLSLWLQSGRLGGKLTPQDVSVIIRAADAGDVRALMDLANECRQKDCHLSAVLTVAEESIAGLKWKLTLPEGARTKDKRAAKWVEGVLRQTPGFRKLVAYLAGARYYGFDVNEIVWKKADGRMVPAEFCHLSHRRFAYEPNTGVLSLYDYSTEYDFVDFRSKWKNKFVVSMPRANGDAQHREGLCRPLIWMTQFRVWTFADWLRTAELSWKPWRIGTYKKGSTDTEDEEGLELILQKLSTTGWAAKPDSMDIAIEWPGGTQSTKATHAELVNTLANEMSKCVLGQTETVQASASSGYAQAKVHDDVRRDIRESAAIQVAEDVTRDVIAPMIALNFTGVIVPQLEFLTQDPVDLSAFALAVLNLWKTGVQIPEKWIRDNAGMPDPVPGEDVLNDPADAEPDPNDPNGGEEDGGGGTGTDGNPPAGDAAKPEDKPAAKKHGLLRRRVRGRGAPPGGDAPDGAPPRAGARED